MAKGRGKEWEAQLGVALKTSGAWRYNTNDINPATDYAAIFRGLGMLLEAKEVHSDILPFASISQREQRHLEAVDKAGGLSAILICRAYPNRRRAWLCTWPDWCHLQETLGRKSIPLDDARRPAELVELERIERPHGLGRAFDLQVALRPHAVAVARRLIKEYPEVLNVQTQAPGQRGQSHHLLVAANLLVSNRLPGRAARSRSCKGRLLLPVLRHPSPANRAPYPTQEARRWR